MYLSVSLSLSLSLSVCLSVYLSLCLSVYLSICLSASLKTKLFCETSSFLLTTSKTNFARRPRFSKLTTSQTKQFCETSSIFQLVNIKNKAFLRDFLQKLKVECRANSFVPMRFAMFPVHPSKVLCLPRKTDARSYEVLHLSHKIILANLQI